MNISFLFTNNKTHRNVIMKCNTFWVKMHIVKTNPNIYLILHYNYHYLPLSLSSLYIWLLWFHVLSINTTLLNICLHPADSSSNSNLVLFGSGGLWCVSDDDGLEDVLLCFCMSSFSVTELLDGYTRRIFKLKKRKKRLVDNRWYRLFVQLSTCHQ